VHRPRPLKVESCSEVQRQARARDQFFLALRGSATIYSKDLSVDAVAAFLQPHFARMEIVGPLGVRVALLHLDGDYLQLYVPRENTVYRFPTAELFKRNARRDRFLALLPVPLYPEIFLDAALTVSQLPATGQPPCRYSEEENLYAFSHLEKGHYAKWIEIDPTRFVPLKVFYFESKIPRSKSDSDWRPTFELRFEKWAGDSLATIPSEISLWRGKERVFLYRWKEAESWKDYDEKAFSWRPGASVKIKDY
jgi:hypothetical protein